MINQIIPPIAVHFIWHPDDESYILSVIEEFRRYLTRDIDRPFSRELNIPTFLYSSRNPQTPPFSQPTKLAEKDVIFVFTSINTLMNNQWKTYIDDFSVEEAYFVVPVAIEKEGMNHSLDGRLQNYNFIRAFDWDDETKTYRGILALAHELYRFGLTDISNNSKGIDSSIKLFLSHAKKGDTGLKHAEAIKYFIDNSNMKRFFDANEISPAYDFGKEIESHIKDSTLIAISSDAYSSRYWCQREILSAKKENRPIILVNSLEEYEDRVFPAASNIPAVHITAEPLDDKNILRILIASLLETIRFKYTQILLGYYQKQGWIDTSAHIFSRPPEIQQIVQILQNQDEKNVHICYPEPPLYKEETEWSNFFNITMSTPLWSNKDTESLKFRIGLSISDYLSDGYEAQHQHLDELKRFAQSLARHLLARENTLIYGGDLRADGFTETILDEASILRDRLQTQDIFVENHLAWPLYTKKDNMRWYANYINVVKPVSVDIPKEVEDLVTNKNTFLLPDCPDNKYVWSYCLTEMRQQSIESSDIRILAGGKLQNYLGKMPGVLEEFLIAYEQKKPIFLIGGLGGLVSLLCQSINSKQVVNEFTKDWQIQHNEGYVDLLDLFDDKGSPVDYTQIKQILKSIKVETLAKNVGLSIEDYQRSMTTPFIDEAIHLILKGLRTLKGEK